MRWFSKIDSNRHDIENYIKSHPIINFNYEQQGRLAPINLLGHQIAPSENFTADKPPLYSLIHIEDTDTIINDDSQNPPAYTSWLKSSSSQVTERPRAQVTKNEFQFSANKRFTV